MLSWGFFYGLASDRWSLLGLSTLAFTAFNVETSNIYLMPLCCKHQNALYLMSANLSASLL